MWNGYGVCSNLASSGEPPASQNHFNHCIKGIRMEGAWPNAVKSGQVGGAVDFLCIFADVLC